jgi:hypothetical protein
LQSFVGTQLQSLEKVDWSWFFRFDAQHLIVTDAPWRLITPQGIAVADADHGQQFGLAKPVDAASCVFACLPSPAVQSVALDGRTGDLRLNFTEATYIQFLQMSCGHEAWHAHAAGGEIICTGGGQTVLVEK